VVASERRPLGADEIEGIEAFAKACASGTFYDILGVDPASSAEAINTAYHQIARQWHPDRFYSRDTGDYTAQIEDNFVAATRAFRTLRDAGKRAAYHRDVGIDVRNARPSSHPGAPPPILDQNLNATVQAGVTSPGGTPVYQTRLAAAATTAAATAASASKGAPLPPRPKGAPTPLDKIRQQLTEQGVFVAVMLLARTANGLIEWKDAGGLSLREHRQRQLNWDGG
jgi:curved DNA-binding protein CbpA